MKHLIKFNEMVEPKEKPWKNLPIIELYYERYMKEYDIVDDYKGMGPGTIFGGDSGYCDDYDDFLERLKDDLKSEVDIESVEFIKDDDSYLSVFIKGYNVTFY
jgi:hypothetical protein